MNCNNRAMIPMAVSLLLRQNPYLGAISARKSELKSKQALLILHPKPYELVDSSLGVSQVRRVALRQCIHVPDVAII